MNTLFMLVYTSKSVRKIDKEIIDNILKVSKINNSRDQLTGLLVARDRYFLQLLEGEKTKVNDCFDRIKSDSRHSQLILQGTSETAARITPHWNMAFFESQDKTNTTEDLLALFDAGRRGEKYTDAKSLESLLRLFSKNANFIG